MAPSMGHATRFAISAEANGVNGQEFEFISCALGKQGSLIIPEGIRGTRSRREESVVDGTYTAGGQVVLEPRPDDLNFLLPFILGANSALAETVGDFYAFVDKGGDVYDYAGCKINMATFRSAPNGAIQLVLDIQGKTEGTNLATLHVDSANTLSVLAPYVHHQGVLTLGNTAYEYNNPELVIDNALVLDRFNNSATRTELPESDRVVTFGCDNPFTSVEAAALYDKGATGLTENTWVITNGAYSIIFAMPSLKLPTVSPDIGARNQEVELRLALQAFSTSTTAELVVTNDADA